MKSLARAAKAALMAAVSAVCTTAGAQSVASIPACRLDSSLAETVARPVTLASEAYRAMGKDLPFDSIAVNPGNAALGARVLAVQVVKDASKEGVSSEGCLTRTPGKSEPLDDRSVRGGCVVVAVERPQIRCSADAVRVFGELRNRPGREHPALLYVLAHELGHLHQRRLGEYAGRVERIDLSAKPADKLQFLKDACLPASTKREEEADAFALQVLIRLLIAPPYREPLFSEQGSLYWSIDQMNLAANTWRQQSLEREFISQAKPHPSFVPTEFPTSKAKVDTNAKRFVCDVLKQSKGSVLYPGKSASHPPLEQRIRRIAEALKPIAAGLPKAGAKQEFKSVAVLQEQISPILSQIYRETGVYLEGVQDGICTRVNSDTPAGGC